MNDVNDMDDLPNAGYDYYKVDIALFNTFRVLHLGGGHIIRPLKLTQLELEGKVFYHNSHYDDIKKYLPKLYPDTEEKAHKILSDILYETMVRRRFLYAICMEKENFPFGYILCSSPLTTFQNSDKEVGEWLIDFWLNQHIHNRGIMTQALPFLFDYLAEFKISKIVAFTDKTNFASIKVLKKLGFMQKEVSWNKNFYQFIKAI